FYFLYFFPPFLSLPCVFFFLSLAPSYGAGTLAYGPRSPGRWGKEGDEVRPGFWNPFGSGGGGVGQWRRVAAWDRDGWPPDLGRRVIPVTFLDGVGSASTWEARATLCASWFRGRGTVARDPRGGGHVGGESRVPVSLALGIG